MKTIILSILSAAAVLTLGACKSTPKGSASIYEGEGPNVHYHDAQAPGSAITTQTYR